LFITTGVPELKVRSVAALGVGDVESIGVVEGVGIGVVGVAVGAFVSVSLVCLVEEGEGEAMGVLFCAKINEYGKITKNIRRKYFIKFSIIKFLV
jgi:hypothetical protein